MSEVKPTVLKIGGSVITDKGVELVARTEVINRLVEEIIRANVKNLIIVHGGGGFGKPVAKKYGIKEGLKDDAQKPGFAETHHVMTVLNGLVMDALLWHNVPAVSVTPLSCMITENGRMKPFEDNILKLLLKMSFTPVLYGDATLDEKLGFTILSGDQIVSDLARKFDACKIVIGGDVDGFYDADPREDKSAKLYTYLTLEELKTELKKIQSKQNKSTSDDVTGGMPAKMAELVPAVEQGIPVTIVNAAKPNRVYKALMGEKVEGTIIEKV